MIALAQQHSALEAAGAQAASIERLFNVQLALAALVCGAVIAAAVWAARRRRPVDEDPRAPQREASARQAVVAAVVVSVAIAFITLWYDFTVGASLHQPPRPALTIRLTGQQWWWKVEYEDPVPQNRVTTANEIHVPVGRPVVLELVSTDVIHSFWAPSLAGKRDLIPGHLNQMWLQASRAGVYRAQCAEYCGLQHSNMALSVIAQSEDEFASWLAAQREPASPPSDSLTTRGLRLFERGTCASCHNITGTAASASLGPDLTHLASRRDLAAGTLPNDSAALAGWIADPHRSKPGVLMPAHDLSAGDLQALVAYLRTLR